MDVLVPRLGSGREVSKHCAESWRLYNPTWEVRNLSSEDLPRVLGNDFHKYKERSEHLIIAHQSDLLRLHIVSKFGGVWVDSTMLCRRPLDEWLPDKIAPAGFFAFSPESINKNIHVVSSFLAARIVHHPLVDSWLELLQADWKIKDTKEYFMIHRDWLRIPEELRKDMP